MTTWAKCTQTPAVLAPFCAILLAACGSDFTPEQRAFFKLPDAQRYAEFEKFPTEKQLDYYRIGMYREPPDLELGLIVARKGRDAVLPLVGRLKREASETAGADLLYLFSLVSRHYPGLKEDEAVMRLLRETASKMEVDHNKTRSEAYIRYITGERGN